MEGVADSMEHCSQKQLFDDINKISFVLDDLRLFLDTHPCDEAALECFEKYMDLREKAIKTYTENYGPIVAYNVENNCDGWAWTKAPWPWEGEC